LSTWEVVKKHPHHIAGLELVYAAGIKEIAIDATNVTGDGGRRKSTRRIFWGVSSLKPCAAQMWLDIQDKILAIQENMLVTYLRYCTV